MLEIGGSSGISTIALAAAAREVDGKLTSLEIESARQTESRETLRSLGLERFVEYVCCDAADVLPSLAQMDLALIDCEKEDYIRFFDMLNISRGGFVIADNIISHSLNDYIAHVRTSPTLESITLNIGKGLEVTRFP